LLTEVFIASLALATPWPILESTTTFLRTSPPVAATWATSQRLLISRLPARVAKLYSIVLPI
jgi:hypothetical protein